MTDPNRDAVDGLVAMARAHREPERPAPVILWLAVAAILAVVFGASVCAIIDTIIEVQAEARAVREFKG